ncbi:hypothetical protein EZS27_030427, partial [termite gut metagenome]
YDIPLMRILTDRGTEYCGAREHHEFQLYLAIEDIEHTKTKAKDTLPNSSANPSRPNLLLINFVSTFISENC